MIFSQRRGMKGGFLGVALFALLFISALAGCKKVEAPLSEAEVTAVLEKTLPTDVNDGVWQRVPVHPAKLLLQDMVEPRLMEASTTIVRIQALTDGKQIAFRMSWQDPTLDDVPGPARFGDAAAVQLPAASTADVPAPQMGEDGKPVEITYWSAIFQAVIDGRKETIETLYPHAKIDHYPFEASALKPGSPAQQEMEQRYAPARAAGNPMAGPRRTAVQDLLAEGPGTLRPSEKSLSSGGGKYSKDGWSVLLVRPLPRGVQPGGRTQAAFAVWQGSHQEVGAKKMRTGWIPLAIGNSQ